MLRHSISRFLLAFLLIGLSAWSSAHAALVLNGLSADAHAIDTASGSPSARNGIGDTTGGNTSEILRTGLSGSTGATASQTIVFVFQLPTVAPSEPITGATLNFTFLSYQTAGAAVATLGNIDLYGLGYRSSSTVLATDYYHGALDPSTSATRIQDNLLATSGLTTNSAIATNASAALTAYINAQYSAGAQAGDYIFFRLSPDSASYPDPSNGARGYNIASADHSTTSFRPTLTLDQVPEPSRALFALLGCTALAFRRSRKPHH